MQSEIYGSFNIPVPSNLIKNNPFEQIALFMIT